MCELVLLEKKKEETCAARTPFLTTHQKITQKKKQTNKQKTILWIKVSDNHDNDLWVRWLLHLIGQNRNFTRVYFLFFTEKNEKHTMICVKRHSENQTNIRYYIVDDMDQSKTDIPRRVKDKDLAPMSRIHVHLTG